jgi:hypothetical protein
MDANATAAMDSRIAITHASRRVGGAAEAQGLSGSRLRLRPHAQRPVSRHWCAPLLSDIVDGRTCAAGPEALTRHPRSRGTPHSPTIGA